MTWRVLVCGPRVGLQSYQIKQILDACAKHWGDDIEIVEGGAALTDTVAGAWADQHKHVHIRVPTNSQIDGEDLGAPKRRNTRMLTRFEPTLCLGFPGHGGTNDMLAKCHDAGVLVWEVEISQVDRNFVVIQWPTGGERSKTIVEGNYA